MICWVKNTYYVPMEDPIPPQDLPAEEYKYISYYQWVPLILLFQALLCYLPSVLWRFLCRFGTSCVTRIILTVLRGVIDDVSWRTLNFDLELLDHSDTNHIGRVRTKIKLPAIPSPPRP